MNDISLLAASVQKVQAAKKGVSLPTSLEGAAISDVIVQDVVGKVTQEALLDDDGKSIASTLSVLGVPFSSLKVDQIRMLCSKWSLKKYRGFARETLPCNCPEPTTYGCLRSPSCDSQGLKKWSYRPPNFVS
jgi:hypothetical protein